MSSIVKKTSHFTPKLKKNPIKKKKLASSSKASPSTPPATQTTQPEKPVSAESQVGASQEEQVPIENEISAPQSPPQTQIETSQANLRDSSIASADIQAPSEAESTKEAVGKPSFNFTLNEVQTKDGDTQVPNKASVSAAEADEDVDPKDMSRGRTTTEVAAESKPDHEVFKKPDDRNPSVSSTRRRSSVRPPHRLSGISQSLMRPRSDSSSIAHGGQEDSEPIKIGIPMTRPKRRRSSLASFSNKKRPSFIGTPVPAVIEVPRNQSETTEIEATPAPTNEDIYANDDKDLKDDPIGPINENHEFVVGVDPRTKKLRKFRRRTQENRHEDARIERAMNPDYIPVAPVDLERRITSAKQIPRLESLKVEPHLYSDIKISTEKLSMAELCKPTFPIGEISSEFEKAQSAQAIIKARRDQRRLAREYARTNRISLEEALRLNLNENDQEQLDKQEENKKALSKFINEQDVEATQTNRIQLNILDGKIHFNEESTIVNKHANMPTRNHEIYEENPFENPITAATYSKWRFTDIWTPDEMVTFYNALSTWGTDFTFIAQLFPYRTRKQIKLKFINEEKKYPELVELALKRKLPVDFEAYCRETNKKFDTLETYEEKLKEIREEHEKHMEEINREKENAMKADLEASRRREIEIRTGAKPMTRKERIVQLRANETVVGSIDDVKKKKEVETEE